MGKKKLPHESLTLEITQVLIRNRLQFFVSHSILSSTLHQDLITLIDSPAYLFKILEARINLKIESVPFADTFDITKYAGEFELPKGKENDRGWFRRNAYKYFIINLQNYKFWEKVSEYWHKGDKKQEHLLRSTAFHILEELDKPWYYTEATMQAILLGMVGWKHDIGVAIWEDTYIPKPSLAIFLNPRTTYDEVKLAIQQLKNTHYKGFKFPRPVPNIGIYQQWYWEKLSGKTYAEIAEKFVNDNEEDPRQSKIGEIEIIKGVKKYASLLKF